MKVERINRSKSVKEAEQKDEKRGKTGPEMGGSREC